MTDLARTDLAADPDRTGHSLGDRRAVARFGSYAEAEAAVDRLAGAGFPVDRAAIVGRGLVVMEVGAHWPAPAAPAGSAGTGGPGTSPAWPCRRRRW